MGGARAVGLSKVRVLEHTLHAQPVPCPFSSQEKSEEVAIPQDGGAAPELEELQLVGVFGITASGVRRRLYNELKPIGLETSASATDPVLSVQMRECCGGLTVPGTRLEKQFRKWMEKKRLAIVYSGIEHAGMERESLLILVWGSSADFVFDKREAEELFEQFLADKGYTEHLVKIRHTDA